MSRRALVFNCAANIPINAKQLIKIAKQISAEYSIPDPWEINFQFLDDDRETLTIRDDVDWPRVLQDNWEKARHIRLFGYDGKTRSEVEFRRDTGILTCDLPIRSGDDADSIRQSYLDQWKCVLKTGDIWRYRNTGVVYRSGDWSLKNLAKGLELALSHWGEPDQLTLDDGFISYEHRDEPNVERLKGAQTLPEFLELLERFDAKTNKVINVGASIRGPAYVSNGVVRGLGFGIFVSHKPTPVTVELRSSIPASELSRRLEPMAEKLGFGKPVPAVISGSTTSGGQPQFDKRPWVNLVLAPLILAAIGLFSWQAFSYVYPDYQTEIIAPSVTEGVPTFAPGPLTVSWFLQPDPKLLQPRIFDATATVEVLRNGVSETSLTGPGQITVTLSTGINTLVIRPANPSAGPLTFQVNVSENSGTD